MMKPQDFHEQRVVRTDTKYQVSEGMSKGPYSGSGILTTGRVVWLRNGEPAQTGSTVAAYAEGVGIVALNPECLK